MNILTLTLGLLLPWLLGMAILHALRGADDAPIDADGELAWLAGTGYLVGVVALTLWMRALSRLGVPFGIASIALPLVAAIAACAYAGARRTGMRATAQAASRALRVPIGIGGTVRFVWWALLAWLALRFVLLGFEVAWRPLFPWEAWIAWATKARVWYELGRMTPFVDAATWFAATDPVWFDAGPGNPATLPLLQVWASIALGRWDDALMNWPWWQMSIALLLLTYGGLRRLGFGALAALLGASFVGTLPLANVHVALAGYADLPLATAYAAAVLAFLRWASTRSVRALAAAIVFAAVCPLFKIIGLAWALTLVPAVAVVLARKHGARIAAALFAVVLFALAVLAQTNLVVAGRSLHLDFAPEWQALSEGYLIFGTWNLLWYGVVGAALLAWRHLVAPSLLPLSTVVAGGLLLLFVLFSLPLSRALIDDAPTMSRATLHLAPVLVVFMLAAFREFGERWGTAHPPPAPDDAGNDTIASAAAGAGAASPATSAPAPGDDDAPAR